MSIINKIKSYEDACKKLGLNPKNLPIVDSLPEKDQKSIIAYYKLIIIIRALNEGWEPDFSDRTQYKYWVWLWVDTTGLHYSNTYFVASYTSAGTGSRLCLKNRKLAEYTITQFKSLYEEYLLID